MAVSSRIMIKKVAEVTIVDFIDAAIMDVLQIQQIGQELYELVDQQDRRYILLDFSNVKFLSSQTLGIMLNLHKKLAGRKGWMGVCGLKKDLHKIFKLTRLDRIFNFYETQQEALRTVRIK